MTREFRLSAIVSQEGKLYVAKAVEIELASQGKTIEEALTNLKEAFELWVKHAGADELQALKKTSLVAQVAVAA